MPHHPLAAHKPLVSTLPQHRPGHSGIACRAAPTQLCLPEPVHTLAPTALPASSPQTRGTHRRVPSHQAWGPQQVPQSVVQPHWQHDPVQEAWPNAGWDWKQDMALASSQLAAAAGAGTISVLHPLHLGSIPYSDESDVEGGTPLLMPDEELEKYVAMQATDHSPILLPRMRGHEAHAAASCVLTMPQAREHKRRRVWEGQHKAHMQKSAETQDSGSWQFPLELPDHQLLKCVYNLAKIGHMPNVQWMQDCLQAVEHLLWHQTAPTTSTTPTETAASETAPVGSTHRTRRRSTHQTATTTPFTHQPQPVQVGTKWAPADLLQYQQATKGYQPKQLSEGDLFSLVWGISRFYQIKLRRLQHQRYQTQPPHQSSQQHTQTGRQVGGPDDGGSTSPLSGPTSSRLSTVLSGLKATATSPDDPALLPAQDTPWPAPGPSWVQALEHAALAVACQGGKHVLHHDMGVADSGRAAVGHSCSRQSTDADTAKPVEHTQPAFEISHGQHDSSDTTSTESLSKGAKSEAGRGITQSGAMQAVQQHGVKRRGSARLFAGVPWCMAVLGVNPSKVWLQTWVMALAPSISHMAGRDVAQIIWSLAALGHMPPESVMRGLAMRIAQLSVERKLMPRDLAVFMWSCATLRYDFGSAFVSEALDPTLLASSSSPMGRRFTPRDAAQVLWSLARVHQRPEARTLDLLLEHVLRERGQKGSMNEQDIVQTVWALATLRYNPCTPARTSLAHAIIKRLRSGSFSPRGLPPLLWSLSRLPWRFHPRIQEIFVHAATDMGSHLAPLDVAMVAYYAATKLKQWPLNPVYAAKLLRASMVHDNDDQTSSIEQQQTERSVQQLSSAFVCSAPVQQSPLMPRRTRLSANPTFWFASSCRTCAMALWSLSRCGVRPHRIWMIQFLAGNLKALPQASPKDLCTLVAALAAMQYKPPRAWRDGVTARVNVLKAMGALGPLHEERLEQYLNKP